MPLITKVLKPEQFTAQKLADCFNEATCWDYIIGDTTLQIVLDRLVSEGILGAEEAEPGASESYGHAVIMKGLA